VKKKTFRNSTSLLHRRSVVCFFAQLQSSATRSSQEFWRSATQNSFSEDVWEKPACVCILVRGVFICFVLFCFSNPGEPQRANGEGISRKHVAFTAVYSLVNNELEHAVPSAGISNTPRQLGGVESTLAPPTLPVMPLVQKQQPSESTEHRQD